MQDIEREVSMAISVTWLFAVYELSSMSTPKNDIRRYDIVANIWLREGV